MIQFLKYVLIIEIKNKQYEVMMIGDIRGAAGFCYDTLTNWCYGTSVTETNGCTDDVNKEQFIPEIVIQKDGISEGITELTTDHEGKAVVMGDIRESPGFCYDVVSNWYYGTNIPQTNQNPEQSLEKIVVQKDIVDSSSVPEGAENKSICNRVVSWMKEGKEYKVLPRWQRFTQIVGTQAAGLCAIFFCSKQPILSFLALGAMTSTIKGESKAQEKIQKKEKKLLKPTILPEDATSLEKAKSKVQSFWNDYGTKLKLYGVLSTAALVAGILQYTVLQQHGLGDVPFFVTYLAIAYKIAQVDLKKRMGGKDDEEEEDSITKELEDKIEVLEEKVELLSKQSGLSETDKNKELEKKVMELQELVNQILNTHGLEKKNQ